MLSSKENENDDRKATARGKARNALSVLDYVGHCHNAHNALDNADLFINFISDEHQQFVK